MESTNPKLNLFSSVADNEVDYEPSSFLHLVSIARKMTTNNGAKNALYLIQLARDVHAK